MTNGKEETIDGNIEAFFMICTFASNKMSALNAFFAEKTQGLRLPKNLDILTFLYFLLHCFAGT